MLKCLFNKFIDLQACNFTKKRLQHRRFLVNIANVKNTYFEKHLRTAGSDSSYILQRKLNKIIQEADWPSRFVFCFFWNIKPLYFIYSYSYSFVVTHCTTRCYLLSLIVIRCTTRCHSLSLVVTRFHSMSVDGLLVCLFIDHHYFIFFLFFTSFIIKTKTKKTLSLKF